jgi:hypothetical protein
MLQSILFFMHPIHLGQYASTRIFPELPTYPTPGMYFSVVQEEMGGGCCCTDQFFPTPCVILILLTDQKDDGLFKKHDRLFLKRGRVLVQT